MTKAMGEVLPIAVAFNDLSCRTINGSSNGSVVSSLQRYALCFMDYVPELYLMRR